MTYTITLNWLFAGNLFTFLFGLAFTLFWLGVLFEEIKYQIKFNFYQFTLLLSGIIITITSAFNILQ